MPNPLTPYIQRLHNKVVRSSFQPHGLSISSTVVPDAWMPSHLKKRAEADLAWDTFEVQADQHHPIDHFQLQLT